MKNLIKISLTTLGTLAILGTTALAVTGTVNAPSGLVLRQEASKTANPITTVPDKTEVNIVEQNGEWYKVTYNSQEGYLFAEYVNKAENVEPEAPTTQEQPTVSNGNLKVYNIPLITSTVINEIDANAEITIIKQITNWSYVSAGEIQGWVRTYGIEGGVQTPVPETPSEEPETQEPIPNAPTVEEPEIPTEEPTVPEQEPENEIPEPSNTAQTEKPTTAKKGFVAVDYANVRKEASTDSAIVTTLTRDTSFKINAETEEWYKIQYTGLDGTVYEGYIFKSLTTI